MNISFDTDITGPEDAAALAAFLIVRFPGCLDGALDQLDKGLLEKRAEDTGSPQTVGETLSAPPEVIRAEQYPAEVDLVAGWSQVEMPDPAAAFGASPPAPATEELDKEGLPWDARIHASTQAKNADGTWRAKRGVNQLLLHQVRAELAASRPQSAGVAATPPASEPAAPSPSAPPPPPADGPSAPPPPPPPSAAERTAAEAVAEGLVPSVDDATPPATLFANALRRVTSLQTQGKLNVGQVKEMITRLGLTEVRELLTRPDLIPAFNASIDGLVAE